VQTGRKKALGRNNNVLSLGDFFFLLCQKCSSTKEENPNRCADEEFNQWSHTLSTQKKKKKKMVFFLVLLSALLSSSEQLSKRDHTDTRSRRAIRTVYLYISNSIC
jgi:hypothetical protein